MDVVFCNELIITFCHVFIACCFAGGGLNNQFSQQKRPLLHESMNVGVVCASLAQPVEQFLDLLIKSL
jgi:hypothetical protein